MTPHPLTYFISYKRDRDDGFAMRLATDLRNAGVPVWMDRIDIVAGEKWDEAVETALHSCTGFVAVLSPESVASKNVRDEISYALDEDKHVIPVLLRKCDYPFRLRRPQHADFTGSYELGFQELLRATKVGASPAPVSSTGKAPYQGTDADAGHLSDAAGQTDAIGPQPSMGMVAIRYRTWRIGMLAGVALALAWLSLFTQYSVETFDPGFSALFLCIDAIAGAVAGRIAGQERVSIRLAAGLAVSAFIGGLASFVMSEPHGVGYIIGFFAWTIGIPLGAIAGAMTGAAAVRRKVRRLAAQESG